MDDLDKLQPQGIELNICNETIVVSPLKFGQFGAFTRAIKPIMGSINTMANGDMDDSLFALSIAQLFVDHSEAMLKAISVAIDRPCDWVENLDMAEALLLAQTVIEVNMDFFAQKLVPQFNQAIQHLEQRMMSGSVQSNC